MHSPPITITSVAPVTMPLHSGIVLFEGLRRVGDMAHAIDADGESVILDALQATTRLATIDETMLAYARALRQARERNQRAGRPDGYPLQSSVDTPLRGDLQRERSDGTSGDYPLPRVDVAGRRITCSVPNALAGRRKGATFSLAFSDDGSPQSCWLEMRIPPVLTLRPGPYAFNALWGMLLVASAQIDCWMAHHKDEVRIDTLLFGHATHKLRQILGKQHGKLAEAMIGHYNKVLTRWQEEARRQQSRG